MTKPKLFVLFATVALATVLSGCGSVNEYSGSGPGFWIGLWDGMTAPLCFFGNLLGIGDWGIYEIHNSGSWYDFGFLIGIGSLTGGVSQASSRK